MDNRQGFQDAFSQGEVFNFTSEILERRGVDSTVYIRSVGWGVKNRFANATRMIVKRLCAIAEKSVRDEDSELIWKDDVKLAEVYLLRQSMCDSDGKLLWDDKSLAIWLETADSEFIEEVLYHCNEFNKLGDVFKPQEENEKEVKKN